MTGFITHYYKISLVPSPNNKKKKYKKEVILEKEKNTPDNKLLRSHAKMLL